MKLYLNVDTNTVLVSSKGNLIENSTLVNIKQDTLVFKRGSQPSIEVYPINNDKTPITLDSKLILGIKPKGQFDTDYILIAAVQPSLDEQGTMRWLLIPTFNSPSLDLAFGIDDKIDNDKASISVSGELSWVSINKDCSDYSTIFPLTIQNNIIRDPDAPITRPLPGYPPADQLARKSEVLPIGGSTGQVLTKAGDGNYNVGWANPQTSDGLKAKYLAFGSDVIWEEETKTIKIIGGLERGTDLYNIDVSDANLNYIDLVDINLDLMPIMNNIGGSSLKPIKVCLNLISVMMDYSQVNAKAIVSESSYGSKRLTNIVTDISRYATFRVTMDFFGNGLLYLFDDNPAIGGSSIDLSNYQGPINIKDQMGRSVISSMGLFGGIHPTLTFGHKAPYTRFACGVDPRGDGSGHAPEFASHSHLPRFGCDAGKPIFAENSSNILSPWGGGGIDLSDYQGPINIRDQRGMSVINSSSYYGMHVCTTFGELNHYARFGCGSRSFPIQRPQFGAYSNYAEFACNGYNEYHESSWPKFGDHSLHASFGTWAEYARFGHNAHDAQYALHSMNVQSPWVTE